MQVGALTAVILKHRLRVAHSIHFLCSAQPGLRLASALDVARGIPFGQHSSNAGTSQYPVPSLCGSTDKKIRNSEM
jgi:hypothetical protein